MQGLFDLVQVVQSDTRWIALITFERLAVGIKETQRGAHPQGFADVASHGLLRRAIPLYPVERPHVPQLRIIHRGIGHAVVVG
ncbi:hypothetical protein D3C85_1692380 [compost metagenome]